MYANRSSGIQAKTSAGAMSTWNSPFRQSYRQSSQPVLNQLYEFGSQGCRFEPCRVQIKYHGCFTGD
jgi:hypothetical protein